MKCKHGKPKDSGCLGCAYEAIERATKDTPPPRKIPGLSAYSRPGPDGKGVIVDYESMTVDLITVLKAGGWTKRMWTEWASATWDEVEVQVLIPPEVKN